MKLYRTIDLIKKSGVSRETIRHYENIGLIRPAKRDNNGYRLYSPKTIDKIEKIKRLQRLNFSLKEIKELLKLLSEDELPCDDIENFVRSKYMQIVEKIKILSIIRKNLESFCINCELKNKIESKDSCPICHKLKIQQLFSS